MTEQPRNRPTEAEINAHLAAIDGAMGAAGHKVDDPEFRSLMRRRIAGNVTSEEVIAAVRKAEGLPPA
ncbi:MAG TPA: hypothetical protein VFU07_05555 [Candidatus Lumbricidophila sp.]|nr:hypothetical protein [Candidatus Lumbricidophila sp.]